MMPIEQQNNPLKRYGMARAVDLVGRGMDNDMSSRQWNVLKVKRWRQWNDGDSGLSRRVELCEQRM